MDKNNIVTFMTWTLVIIVNNEQFSDLFQLVEKSLEDYLIDEVFVSFNGGKDCTVLLHLVHSVLVKKYGETEYPKLTAVYFKPENSFKEIEDFIYEAANRYVHF